MSFARSHPVIVLVFLLLSSGLWALGISLMPEGARGNYAVLVCSEAVSGREIRERLEPQGFTNLVCESGQWVLLDNFETLELIPLDEYDARILPFDPRNDGYAEKLRSLFVRDLKRFVYIPLESSMPAGLNKRLASAMGDIPYSLEYAVSDRPSGSLLFALFCLAACALFVIRPLRLALRPDAAPLIPCLPALVPLALGGAAGFAMAALLAGLAVLLAGPCRELLALPRRRRFPRGLPGSFMLPWLLPPLLLACYGLLAFFSGLPVIFTLLAFALFCGALALSLWGASRDGSGKGDRSFARRDTGRRRFSPVPILKRSTFSFSFSWVMLPFTVMALALAFAGLVMPASLSDDFPSLPPGAVTEEDYRSHFFFQATFSLRALGKPVEFSGMNEFELAPDGLIGQIPGKNSPHDAFPDDEYLYAAGIPPFPLGNLLRDLDTVEGSAGSTVSPGLLFVLLPLFFILPAVIRRGR